MRALPVAHTRAGRWGAWVIAKTNLPQLLEQELALLARSGRLADATIFMSSATDPYQGVERRLGLTRRALEAFVRYPPRRLVIQTRSPLIERDLDVIGHLGERAIASITLETDDDSVRHAITPTSPAVARRLTTMRRLRAAGIFTQIAIAPMLPNHPQHFADLAAEVSDRAIVDTYFDGDGARGRRSRALGIGELYERLGTPIGSNSVRSVNCWPRCARGWATIACSSAGTASTPCNISAMRQACRPTLNFNFKLC